MEHAVAAVALGIQAAERSGKVASRVRSAAGGTLSKTEILNGQVVTFLAELRTA